MINCNTQPFNPYCTCFDNDGKSVPKYRQYNGDTFDTTSSNKSTGIGARCCNTIHQNPAYIADRYPNSPAITTVNDYLKKLTDDEDSNPSFCDYTNFGSSDTSIEENFPELFLKANVNRKLFNTFFQYQSPIQNGATNNRDLLPIIDKGLQQIRCNLPNYTPHWLVYNYYSKAGEDNYIHICLPDTSIATVSLPGVNYEIKRITENTGSACEKTRVCTTKHEVNVAYNVGSTINKNNNINPVIKPWEIAILVAVALFFYLGYVYLLYHVGGFENRRNNRKQKIEEQLQKSSD